jgi:predicted restriction endonuclease
MNPARRRDSVTEQIREAISNEPHPSERTTISPRQVWECRDDAVRQFLKEEYGGSCQICLDGFPKRDGQPFFVSKYIVSRTTARTVEHAGNSLCLCPTCAAKFEHGEVLCDNPEQQVLGLKLQREGGQNELVLRLRLCGKDVKIRYSEKHLLNFQQLLQAAAE